MSNLQSTIQELKTNHPDIVRLPEDPGYKESAKILLTEGRPAVVVRPKTVEDVALAIKFARDNKLVLSVRCGGHSGGSKSTNDGGVVIDLRDMNSVEVVDEAQRVVRVGGGALWSVVAQVLKPHHLAITSGDTKSVGVGGLATGGGIGWMVRKYGLTIDNMVGAELVTADGQILHLSDSENPELFWAVRGGGGNFGVVTCFELVAQPIDQVYGGMIMYDIKNLAVVLKGWRDYMRTAPEELTTMFNVLPPNPATAMPAAVMLLVCYAGDDEAAAMQAIDPLLKLGEVLNHSVQRKDYGDVLEEARVPQGVKVIVNNVFIRELSDEVIDTVCKNTGQVLQIRSLGGAMNRVPADATAFAHRSNEVLIVSPTFVPENATPEVIKQALQPWRNIAADGSGAYCNFLAEVTPEALAAAYPPGTYERLAHIKKQYDPDNIFSQNVNIKPNDQ